MDSMASAGSRRTKPRSIGCWAGIVLQPPPLIGSLPSSMWTSRLTVTPSGTSTRPVASTGPRSRLREPFHAIVSTIESVGNSSCGMR
jgi:hypothetical protein